jgi:AcrR family transcriptional regulator
MPSPPQPRPAPLRGSAVAERPDRAAAVRRALRTLVAERGFHGASMSEVARLAGVATGTAYVHYPSKDALVLAAYLETKRELGAAAVAEIDPLAAPRERFTQLWAGIYRHLAAVPERARFLVQVDGSPYAIAAHELGMAADDDPILAEAARPDMQACLADLPMLLLYDLGIAPAVRLAAAPGELDDDTVAAIAHACWRAITAG